MQTVVYIFSIIGAYTLVSTVLSIYQLLFGDRTGNSGRYKHWTEEDN